MPLSKYDRYFGGKGGARKAHDAMAAEYGDKKGESVFYATMNRNKSGAPACTVKGCGKKHAEHPERMTNDVWIGLAWAAFCLLACWAIWQLTGG